MSVLQPNHLLDGRYRIISHLAEGGFGYTYLAEDNRRPSYPKCVVKQLKPDISNSRMLDDARRLFRTEAETLEKLGENNQIPRLLAYFEKDGEFYLIQEFIKGSLLSEELQLGEPWSETSICKMLLEVLEILSFVHENKVIHRDIKPDNIIRRYEDKKLVLVDFGSVKQIRDYESQVNGTVVVGTSGYMSTEQGRGSPRLNSDIYALGMIAVQAATGLNVRQFQEDANTGEIIWQPWAKEIDKGLAFILTKMIRHHFVDRYQSTQEVIQDLEKNLASVPKAFYLEQKIKSLSFRANNSSIANNDIVKKLFMVLPIVVTVISLSLIALFWRQKDREIPIQAQPSVSPESQPEQKNTVTQQPSVAPDSSQNKELQISLGNQTNSNTPLISSGEKALLSGKETNGKHSRFQIAKQQGIAAMEARDYPLAISYFEGALKENRNAPETRIYLNNAKSQVEDRQTYTIAVVVPLSLDRAAAEAMLRGVAQAQEEINQAGGINGIPLRVVIANDGDDLATARKIASELGQNEEILGVVGHYYSSRTLAAGKIYEQNQLVAIALSSSTEIENFSEYVFRTSPGDNLTAQALAQYMVTKLGKNKAAVFYDPNSKYSMSLRTEFVRAINNLGGQIVAQSDWSIDNFDAEVAVSRAMLRGAEVLMLVPDNAEQIKQGLEVARISQQRFKLLGGDVMYSPKTLELGAENVVDMTIGAFWHIDADADSQFSLTSKQLWGAEVNWISAMAYDATQALIQALRLQPNPDRLGVKQVISDSDFSASGASNSVSFLPSGNRIKPHIQLVKIVKEQKSRTGYSFEPISD